ncbi:YggS family pyridoxal phosphate-dependent enzyme [Sutcliffiella rhizosphaerae]|uniref:Pyridoxal phosphate homeostasis protein n=1 Tax=Sutcliffiella rhizosphaerae TaxID=2880967 RepID=A0ABM8YIW8_9BACI|nr:YggS family pyridoxal phosphate-dependent enzyme [Sutcliffiella rhizosphaerae]CAG9619790.1 Pyridoxal phosphate homeostasis protein [Sutcliffiella rhizosphaerae]
MDSHQSVLKNLEIIRTNILEACKKGNRNPDEVKVIGVTKYVSTKRASEALTAGITHLGENREEGLLAKQEELHGEPIWHFIGSLQSKKVKKIIKNVDYIHSLDRESLAKELHKRAEHIIKCFVQVNVSQEESKHGLLKEEALNFIKKLEKYPNIKVVGLMTMAPYTDDEEVLRFTFRELRVLKEKIQAWNLPYAPCTELSMGMSNDYMIAIEEGATFIRIGSALVGNEQ